MSSHSPIEATKREVILVDQILRGIRPADLPTKYWLAINLKTAKAIGVTMPGRWKFHRQIVSLKQKGPASLHLSCNVASSYR